MRVIICDRGSEGLHGWISGSAMKRLDSGNIVSSRHGAGRVNRMT